MAHWSRKKEAAGSIWQMRLMFSLYRRLGISRIRFILDIVVVFFFLFSPSARRVSRLFLTMAAAAGREHRVNFLHVYRHFHCFSYSLLEKLSAWAQDIKVKDLGYISPDAITLQNQLKNKHGAVILCSHLGNTEMLRALASLEAGKTLPQFGINSIVDFTGTSKFNQLLKEINPESMVRLVSASSIGADTIIDLSQRLSDGELVIIAADRTAANNQLKTGIVRFLGKEAHFPLGAFVLASLLDAPIYHMFALREKDLNLKSKYEFHVFKSIFDLAGSRRERMIKIQGLMEEYVGHLEKLCTAHPYQWFNFFNFWRSPGGKISDKI